MIPAECAACAASSASAVSYNGWGNGGGSAMELLLGKLAVLGGGGGTPIQLCTEKTENFCILFYFVPITT